MARYHRMESEKPQVPLAQLAREEALPLHQPVGASGPAAVSASVGNDLLAQSLGGGGLGGFGDAVLAGVAAQACGLGESPLASNAAMQRMMRHAQGEDPAPGQRISLARLQSLVAASTGAPLPAAVAGRMGEVLGHDFSRVRIHTDSAALLAARGISARAFTTGHDVYFGASEYRPGTPAGDELIAHELAHVVQHDQGRIHGRGVSSPSDPLEKEAEALGRAAARGLSRGTGEQAAGEDAPSAQRFGEVIDADAARARQTQQLVRDLVRALGLPAGSVAVRLDEEAAAATAGLGTRGLMRGGEVLLDPERFDPAVSDGRALLAHEVAHVAQAGLAPAGGGRAGELAEAEAHLFAARFAAGGAPPALEHGLPAGHVAAEGPVSGDALQQLLAQQRGTAEGQGSNIQVPPPTPNTVGDPGTESHERKVSRYQDGVDGIADEISDLEAFDQLCEAVDNEQDTTAALEAIRATESYHRLCEMWQGAKEGGVDRPAMEAAFNEEFNGRGFWGSTEQAFDLVEAAAKRDARPRPEAEAARNKKNEAESRANQPVQDPLPGQGGEGDASGQGADPGAVSGLPPGVDPALLDATVEQQEPALAAYQQLTTVSDEELTGLQQLLNHRQGLASEVGGAQWDDRLSQVGEAFWDGFSGTFVSSFTDQAFDTLVLDSLGTLADKGLTVATRGAFRVPFVGPLIGLAMTKPWEANSFGEWAGNAFGINDMGSESAAALFQASTWTSGWEHVEDVGDFFGVLCDKFADLFEGLRDITKGLATLAGTLSALSYVIGGILIGVGLALVWLAGIGAPLITAGTWLVNAGTILGRVATALGLIALSLSLLAAVFRAAAAVLVPAEMYAEQLSNVGTAASAFGEAAGNKAGDVTANHARDAATARFAPRGADTPDQAGDEGASGRTDAQNVDQRIRTEEEGLRQVRDDLDAAVQEQQRQQQAQQDGNQPRSDDPANQPRQDDPDAPRSQDDPAGPTGRQRLADWGRDVARVFNPVANLRRGISESIEGIREMQHALTRPGEAAAEALDPRSRQMIEERLRQHNERLQEQTQQLTERIRQVQGWVDHLDLTPARAQELRRELLMMRAHLAALDLQLNGIRGRGGAASSRQHMDDQRAHHERADRLRADVDAQGDGVRDRYDELRREKDRLSEENTRLDRDVRAKEADLEEARRAQREADAAETDLQRQQREHDAAQEPYRQARQQGQEAERLRAEQQDQRQRADALADQARAIREVQAIDADIHADSLALNVLTQRAAETDRAFNAAANGQVIDVPDHPYGPRMAVMGVDAQGVRVADAGGGEHYVSPGDLPASMRDLADQAVQRHSDAEPLRQHEQALLDRRQTTLRNANLDESASSRDPAAVDQEAANLRQSADALQPRIDGAQAASTHNGHSDVPQHMHDRTRDLERQRSERERARTEATDRITALEGEIRALREQSGGNERRLGELEQEIARQREVLAMQEQEGLARRDWDLGGASSGNATGNVGSSYKEAFAFLWETFLSKEQAANANNQPAGAPTPADEQQAATNGFGSMIVNNVDGLQNWKNEELRRRYQAHWQAIGDRQADVEQLLELYPPVSFDELARERQAAVAAYERYSIAHSEAYKAYVAEQRVAALAAETEALARSADPLRQESQRQAAPLQQSLADEGQRQTILAGGDTSMEEGEGGAEGVVMRLISLVAEHADSFDSQPQPGDSSAGTAIGNASADSTAAAEERMGQAATGSEQQRAFLDQAILLRSQQEGQICSDITTVEGKHQEELAILDEIKQVKAQRLAERDAARAETEGHAGTFNAGVEQIRGWADQYRARREGLQR